MWHSGFCSDSFCFIDILLFCHIGVTQVTHVKSDSWSLEFSPK